MLCFGFVLSAVVKIYRITPVKELMIIYSLNLWIISEMVIHCFPMKS